MARIVVIGNAGGGKSTLARRLAIRRGLRHVELDRLLWGEGWTPTPPGHYTRQHDDVLATEDWVADGLGQQASIPRRLARASEIILIDMPLWMHFWLAAERQIAWATGSLAHPPAGLAHPPPTQALFRTIAEVEESWMPEVRALCVEAEEAGRNVLRLRSVEELDAVTQAL